VFSNSLYIEKAIQNTVSEVDYFSGLLPKIAASLLMQQTPEIIFPKILLSEATENVISA